jgi:hypothetical protein
MHPCINPLAQNAMDVGRSASPPARVEADGVRKGVETAAVSASWGRTWHVIPMPGAQFAGFASYVGVFAPTARSPGSTNEADPSLWAGWRREPRDVVIRGSGCDSYSQRNSFTPDRGPFRTTYCDALSSRESRRSVRPEPASNPENFGLPSSNRHKPNSAETAGRNGPR